jgi:hypothetical protein
MEELIDFMYILKSNVGSSFVNVAIRSAQECFITEIYDMTTDVVVDHLSNLSVISRNVYQV